MAMAREWECGCASFDLVVDKEQSLCVGLSWARDHG
jgi:hypothetical protein